jgi:hypothetical protein
MAKKTKPQERYDGLLKDIKNEISKFNKQCREATFDDPEDTRTPDESDWLQIIEDVIESDRIERKFHFNFNSSLWKRRYYQSLIEEANVYGNENYYKNREV